MSATRGIGNAARAAMRGTIWVVRGIGRFAVWFNALMTKLVGTLTAAALCVAVASLIWPEKAIEIAPGLRGFLEAAGAIEENVADINTNTRRTAEAVEGAKREVSNDPEMQLANLGIANGAFVGPDQHLLSAIDDGRYNVVRLILETDWLLSSTILRTANIPQELQGRLVANETWKGGSNLCMAMEQEFDSVWEITAIVDRGNLGFVKATCPASVLALRSVAQKVVDEYRSREDENERRRARAAELRRDCEMYTLGPDYRFGLLSEVVRFIRTNGDYYDPPKDFRVPQTERSTIRQDVSVHSDKQRLLDHASYGNIGVRGGRLTVLKTTRSIQSLDSFVDWIIDREVERVCVPIEPILASEPPDLRGARRILTAL